MLRLGFAIGVIALMAACNLPRGAALEPEITEEANAPVPQIALYRVTRETLPEYKYWPKVGSDEPRGWLRHQHTASENVIAANDIIDIVVWDSEDASLLSGRGNRATQMEGLKVSAGGTIFLPFAGTVQVTGLSETAARNRIQKKMSEAVPSAQVQISVQKGPMGSVSVVSGVSRPGVYPIENSHVTILNAIAAAGGANVKFDNPQLRLIRGGRVYIKSLAAVLDNPDLDTVLRGGDKISVELDTRYFRSLGAASKEAIFPFTKDKISALDAMSIIGGVSETRADLKGIMILRQYKASQVRTDGTGPSNDRAAFVFDISTADGLFSAGQFDVHSEDTVLVTESSVASTSLALQILARLAGAATDIDSLLK